MKKLLLLLTLALVTQLTFAQNVPSYVPSDGLVGYWGFNGNADDQSGNGNNGTNNGATLTTDRFGNINGAYNYDGINNSIQTSTPYELPLSNSSRTISSWLKIKGSFNINNLGNNNNGFGSIFEYGNFNTSQRFGLLITQNNFIYIVSNDNDIETNIHIPENQWLNVVVTYSNNSCLIYLNSNLVYQGSFSNLINTGDKFFSIGNTISDPLGLGQNEAFNGKIDDIGIWNRALTQDEITNLYNANQCITNITVTDTLVINIGQLSFNDPVAWANNITIAPNPASNQININFNTITDLTGGQIHIINSLGQQVATTPITLSGTNTTMPLTTWGGTGLYFVQIINSQGQIVDIKKIILQ